MRISGDKGLGDEGLTVTWINSMVMVGLKGRWRRETGGRGSGGIGAGKGTKRREKECEKSKEEIAEAEGEVGGRGDREECTMSPTSVRQIMMHRRCRGWFYHRRLIRDA